MQPIATHRLPTQKEWIHQIKYDGIRLLCVVQDSKVQLWTRKQNNRNTQYPELLQISNFISAKSFILDGEVIVRSKENKPTFSLILKRDRNINPIQIHNLIDTHPLEYHLFDILMKDGQDLRNHPLEDRLQILSNIIMPNEQFFLVQSHSNGQLLWEQIKKNGWEGVVSKKLGSSYMYGKKHQAWYKSKVKQERLCVVGGIQYKANYPNSLLLGNYLHDQLLYIGKASTGLSSHDFQLLHQYVPQLEQQLSPFVNPPLQQLPIKWIQPLLTIQVQYTEKTDDGLMRHPIILGFTSSPANEARWEI